MIATGILEGAIAQYNEYREPMASAELIDSRERAFVVRFEGPFCRMCCDYDYFEDLIYELSAFGVDETAVDVTDIDYAGDETFVVAFSTAGE